MKIKKLLVCILAVIMIIIMSVCAVGCSDEQIANDWFGERFGVVERISDKAMIIYDKETKVEYLYCAYHYNTGLTVLLDENGKPLLYEGE